jgi:hypothetical protein
MLINGPDSSKLKLTQVDATHVAISAAIDDRRNGNQAVASAVYSVDHAYWQPGYVPKPMQPKDGSADSPLEVFRGKINTAPLSQGKHTIFVRGTDANGNAGPVSAIFLNKP